MLVPTPPVGIVAIVTHNCRGYIGECLESLEPARGGWEVVVVDNGSRDGTPDLIRRSFPWVKVIEARANIGFSAACNAGAAASSAPWILFLNPDTIVQDGALGTLVDTALRRNVPAVAPQLIDRDGRYQPMSAELRLPSFTYLALEFLLVNRVWPRNPWRRRADVPAFDPAMAGPIEQPIAAGLLVRRDVFDAVGRFDERFHPLWFEDVDICKNILEAGHTIWYEPRARVIHISQHTLGLFTTTTVRAMYNANLMRYVRKHFSPGRARAMLAIAIVGTLLRALLRAADPRAFRTVAGHFALIGRMMRHADESRWYSVSRLPDPLPAGPLSHADRLAKPGLEGGHAPLRGVAGKR